MLNIKTFKMFCLKAGTKKSEQIHEYYINLEETLQEVIQEESNELKLQLEKKTTELQNQIIISDKDKDKIREKTILDQFPNNTQCVYYGIIDNLSNKNEKLVKFGNSNNLKSRVRTHKDTYLNFRLINAFKVGNLYNNNKNTNALGYSKYWETGMIYPNKILNDLILIFHPELINSISNKLTFYKKIN